MMVGRICGFSLVAERETFYVAVQQFSLHTAHFRSGHSRPWACSPLALCFPSMQRAYAISEAPVPNDTANMVTICVTETGPASSLLYIHTLAQRVYDNKIISE